MEKNEPNQERVECPDRNARCAKLAAKTIGYFADGGDYIQLDPRFGGLAWNFADEQHYDHIASAVNEAAGVSVERADTFRHLGTEETPVFGLRRSDTETKVITS